jgi:hypothetical protein
LEFKKKPVLAMHWLAFLSAYLTLVVLRIYSGFRLHVSSAESTLAPQGSPRLPREVGWQAEYEVDFSALEKALQEKYGPALTIDLPNLQWRRNSTAPNEKLQPMGRKAVDIRQRAELSAFGRPKPLSILMNFGLDGVSRWSDSADEWQDDCPPGTFPPS